ncbi:Hpt domain-containing protein [Massilia aurea]|uniref:hybrid sensor histidine kinase/response regulator n=1 Tax=Massilia aurea TaxID=373040 RepID=UPI0034636A85
MTTLNRSSSFDTGPLSWVIGEIRDALTRAATSLRDAAGRSPEAQPTLLLHAKSHLHQAHGALQMVDVEGVGVFTGAAEAVLDRFKDGQLPCTLESVQVVLDAFGALGEYLDELLAGAPQQPARLFPYYRDMVERQGELKVHPADLLPLDVPRELSALPALAPAAVGEVDIATCRTQFEKALLPYLKAEDDAARRAQAEDMVAAIAPIAGAQEAPRARLFWQAMHAFATVVADGQVATDLYIKQLFGQINLQLRRLAKGQQDSPEAMLRDALFFVAAARTPGLEARTLRQALGLDGAVPHDYAERRYGKLDPQALKEAREALARTKSDWDLIAGDGKPDAAVENDFNDALARLAGASEKLGAPALAQLLRELGRAAGDSVQSGRDDQFGLEMAAAMLFVENSLDQLRQLPDDFSQNAEAVGARLLALAAGETPPDAPHWQGELARQIQQGQTVAVLAGEVKAGLRQIEKLLDDYYDDPSKRQVLEQAGPVLHSLQGAFAILDQEQAVLTLHHVEGAVRLLADSGLDVTAQHASLHNIAQNIGALGFFADLLAQDSALARGRFTFDLDKQLLRELPFEFVEAPQPAVASDVDAPAAPVVVDAAQNDAQDDAQNDIDAELLEIFIAEAQEVLAFVVETLPRAADEPGNQETLTGLRRAFHTLKGSSRMVGLDEFGATAASIERVMNVWLADGRAATADMLALLAHAYAELDAWVTELAAGQVSRRDGAALIEVAARVQDGGAFEPLTDAAPAPAAEPDVDAQLDAQLDDIPVLDLQITPAGADAVRRVGDLAIGQALHDVYLLETESLCATLETAFAQLRSDPAQGASPDAITAAHTLAGTSATVGYTDLCELAHALEMTLENLAVPGALIDEDGLDLFDATLSRMRTMLQVFTLGELAPAQLDLIEQLAALRARLDASPFDKLEPALATQLDALFAEAYDQLLADPPPFAAPAARDVGPKAPAAPDDIDDIFASMGDDPFAAPALEQATPPPQAADFVAVTPDEAVLSKPESEPEPEPEIEPEFEPEPEDQPAPESDDLLEPELVGVNAYVDEIDADLLPVFLEEATDLLPRIGHDLRKWQQEPSNGAVAQRMQRDLHTVKGSARMAGAMRLGQHAHELETQIENMVHAGTSTLLATAFDELLANYDGAMLLFEQLQQPATAQADASATATATAPALAPTEPARAPLVRVRADILDRVVNQAGEVSITRSRLENQIGVLKSSLGDFSDNVGRLRRQLREIEMQAESQIASRLSIAGEREFDPLEFDRFTRLQELTRMLAESVDDVASFQESLARTVDSANEELSSQARMTRDLQRDLMRVRMVPFASLSERLFRVARQTAKETDKRVNLDIRGGAVEIDRGVLEQMAAPFEHLLRNAIVHGIEPRAARQGAGKAETGELLVQVSQHGNEVLINFSDDGAGLDLERIRAKALAGGLIAEGDDAPDEQVTDLIFEPGFSTADTLTELAGRGVGMDVVRSEAQALGGRVAVVSETGQGARFTITLPLTLAVAQVVLVVAGGRTHAVPSTLVDAVQQVREADLAVAIEDGSIALAGHELALYGLPGLLGDEEEARTTTQRSTPVLVLNGGSRRIALRVDEVLGNREVVVKNIGRQMARMPGIDGATVLGSGEIVLILDPLALAQQPQGEARTKQAAAAPQARRPTVMVVDDSLTVRRVTQRLLEREGYRVVLAKDGIEALELIGEGAPDLMLVDIEMPRMDGFDLTRNVRGNEATRAIPIIMITSRTADKHRNVALGLGVNAYFGKPYQETVLLAAIEGLLGREAA